MYFKGSQINFQNYDVILSLKAVQIVANSANADEMQHYAAFHLGIHYLQKYPFRGFRYTAECQWNIKVHIHIKLSNNCRELVKLTEL